MEYHLESTEKNCEYYEMQAGCVLTECDTGIRLSEDKTDGETGHFRIVQQLKAGKSYEIRVGWSGCFDGDQDLYPHNFDPDDFDAPLSFAACLLGWLFRFLRKEYEPYVGEYTMEDVRKMVPGLFE